MRVLICDDEQKMIDLEVSMLQKYCQSANVIATFYAFTDSLSAENTDEFDIAFLDIDMAELNGIELARRLRLKNPTAVIIFVTNFIQYAPEGYEVQAFRYLLKSDIPSKLMGIMQKPIFIVWCFHYFSNQSPWFSSNSSMPIFL